VIKRVLASGDVAVVDINTEDLGIFKAVYHTFEVKACGSYYIEHFLDRFFGVDSS
jgi:hypothetical protein